MLSYVKRYTDSSESWGRLMALSEYPELTWRKKNSLARRYVHFPIALLAQFDLDHVPSVFPRQFEMHERANPLDMTDNGLDGRSPITVALDLDIIGTHIAHGRNVLSIGVLWNLDFELPQACLSGVDAAMEKVDIPQEMVDEGCRRMIIHFLWRADLLRPTLVHDHHTIRHLQGLFLIVCDEDTRDMHLVMQTTKPATQFFAHLGIERTERFIEQQHLRLYGERPGQGNALTLTARELCRIAVRQPIELH